MQKKNKKNNPTYLGGNKLYWIYGVIGFILLGFQFNAMDQLTEIDQLTLNFI